jgi:tripeptide aminopeptidase
MSPASRAPAAEPPTALQQEVARLAALPEVRSVMEWFRDQEAQFTRWQLEVARIAAPPFGEQARSDWLAEQFAALGLGYIERDSLGNVFGSQAAVADSCVSVSAHLDTVFPAGTAVDARQQGRKLYGPSVSDNSAGVTALLAVATAVVRFGLLAGDSTQGSLLFIGNVGEEGEGDLRGMRYLYGASPWGERIGANVVLDGAGCEVVVTQGLGSRRFLVTVKGPGGHSWTDAGTPNPIVVMSRAIAAMSEVALPASPRTTLNIGTIEGGSSVNSIPEFATARFDLRSLDADQLVRLEVELHRAVEDAVLTANAQSAANKGAGAVQFLIERIGDRPAGRLNDNSPLLKALQAADRHLGIRTEPRVASTDANIPLSLGIPALSIGAGGDGGGIHTRGEWYDASGRELALKRILLLLMLALDHVAHVPVTASRS